MPTLLFNNVRERAADLISVENRAVDRSTFEFGERLGIVFIAQTAGLSALAVGLLGVYILYSTIAWKRGATRNWTVATHIHYYFINLLVSDLIQALGGLMSIKWVVDARVYEGPYCTTQGILKQVGDVGVALTSLTIAIYTFLTLVFRLRIPHRSALIVIACIWVFIALIIGIGYATNSKQGQQYYGNTQYWCWITEDNPGERIGLEYFWMWLAAAGNLFLYLIIALVVKGVLIVTPSRKVRFRNKKEDITDNELAVLTSSDDGERSRRLTAIATQMLFYPAVYIVTVTPIAIARWSSFSGHRVPFAGTCFASILFASSGFLHVLLFGLTRPRLLPSRDKTLTAGGGVKSEISSLRTGVHDEELQLEDGGIRMVSTVDVTREN